MSTSVDNVEQNVISGYGRQNVISYIPIQIINIIRLFCQGSLVYFSSNHINVTLDVLHPYKLKVNHLASCLCNDGQSILIFGGVSYGSSTDKVYKYNTKTGEYISVCNMPQELSRFKVARTPDNKIVAIGSRERSCYERKYFIYDENTNKWETKKLPNNVIAGPWRQITFDLNDNLHVIGGEYSSNKCHYICEWNTQKWIKLKDLSFELFGAGLCCGPNGLLYLFGGKCNGNISNLMWIYNVNTKEWKLGTSMPDKRYYFGYINTINEIIVAGGHDGNKNCNDIFIYNFKSQKWLISNKKLLKNIYGFTMTITNNFEIHSFGGNNGNNYVNYRFIIKP